MEFTKGIKNCDLASSCPDFLSRAIHLLIPSMNFRQNPIKKVSKELKNLISNNVNPSFQSVKVSTSGILLQAFTVSPLGLTDAPCLRALFS